MIRKAFPRFLSIIVLAAGMLLLLVSLWVTLGTSAANLNLFRALGLGDGQLLAVLFSYGVIGLGMWLVMWGVRLGAKLDGF